MKENKPISVEHVSKSFGERKVLKDVCVEFEKAHFFDKDTEKAICH